jgi:hypothetical protein
MLKIFFILAGFIFTTPIFAQSWTDPSRTVLWVKVDSEGTLELKFADAVNTACGTGFLAFMKNTHPNYTQVLALATAAISKPRKVLVGFAPGLAGCGDNGQRTKLTSLVITNEQ